MSIIRMFILAVTTIIGFTWYTQSWSYGIEGGFGVRASPGPLEERSISLEPIVTFEDIISVVDGEGNAASTAYFVDLAGAVSGAKAFADYGTDSFAFSEVRGLLVSVVDKLFFTLLTGNYSTDIAVKAEGSVEFQANAGGRGQTSGSANARLRVDRFRIGAFALQASGGFDEFIVSPPFVLE